MNSKKTIKSALESMMYIWGEPLDVKTAAEVCNITKEDALSYLLELQQEYDQQERGLMIRQVNKSFQFATRAENAAFIERLCTPVKARRLSQSALEVLAIIAYKQPVTKSEIDSIRGIKCDRVVEGLEKRELVVEVGRSDGVGRPILYGTTDTFLKQFGFSSIKELPEIMNIEEAVGEDPEDLTLDRQISMDEAWAEASEAPAEDATEAKATAPATGSAEDAASGFAEEDAGEEA